MIDYANKDLLLRSDTDKQLRIKSDIGNITNADLESGTFALEESLCNDDYLRFGACVPSRIDFTVHNTVLPLINKKLTLDLTPNGKTTERLDIGTYFVTSDTPTADRKKRNTTAYDALYKVINSDVVSWYNSVFPTANASKTLKQLRNSFCAYFGIEQEEQDLVNDSMTVKKTIEPEELSGKTVIEAICEINGCFGRIGRNGKMKYIYLNPSIEGLYPSNDLYPGDNLFPREASAELIDKQTYIPPCEYETFLVKGITGLQIRKEENDVGATVGTTENLYVIQDNFLVYGKSASELNTIANNILSKIRGLEYRPFSTKAKGNPCLEVGDAVRLNTSEQKIESYIMHRTIKGVQQMFDEYTAKGREYLGNNLNTTANKIRELQGKTLKIIKENNEFRILMEDTLTGLTEELAIIEGEIALRVTQGEVGSMISVALDNVTIRSDQIRLEGYTTINGNFSIDKNGNMVVQSENSTMTVDGGYIKLQSTSGNLMQIGVGGVRQDSTWLARLFNNAVRLGDSSRPTYIDGSSVLIKGYTPITTENIDSYVPGVDALLSRIQSLENQLASLNVPTNSNQIDGDFRTGANGAYMAMKNSTGNQYLATTEWVMNYVTNKLG